MNSVMNIWVGYKDSVFDQLSNYQNLRQIIRQGILLLICECTFAFKVNASQLSG